MRLALAHIHKQRDVTPIHALDVPRFENVTPSLGWIRRAYSSAHGACVLHLGCELRYLGSRCALGVHAGIRREHGVVIASTAMTYDVVALSADGFACTHGLDDAVAAVDGTLSGTRGLEIAFSVDDKPPCFLSNTCYLL